MILNIILCNACVFVGDLDEEVSEATDSSCSKCPFFLNNYYLQFAYTTPSTLLLYFAAALTTKLLLKAGANPRITDQIMYSGRKTKKKRAIFSLESDDFGKEAATQVHCRMLCR